MPLLPPPPPPTAAPGCGRRRLSGRRRRRSKRRNWAELPLDVMLSVLHKLDDVELMFGSPAGVCRSWHDAVCEPELWRRVDMRGRSRRFRETVSLKNMAQLSIWFSAGQCREFFGQHDVDNDLLLFLADRAPLLKSLHLIKRCDVTSETFAKAIMKFPLLEELELWECETHDTGVFDLVAMACPLLKHVEHVKDRGYSRHIWVKYPVNNGEALAIARMHELRSLKLFHGGLDNQGLTAILDGCPHLEYLDIRYCSNIIMDSSMRAKCARVKKKKMYPYAPTDNWVCPWSDIHDDFTIDSSEYLEPDITIRSCYFSWGRDRYWWYRDDDDEPDCRFFNAEPCDSEDSDHSRFFSGAEEGEFEYWRT